VSGLRASDLVGDVPRRYCTAINLDDREDAARAGLLRCPVGRVCSNPAVRYYAMGHVRWWVCEECYRRIFDRWFQNFTGEPFRL
jgi:hypothetical protein